MPSPASRSPLAPPEARPALSPEFVAKFAHQLRTAITALQGTHFLLSRQLAQLPAEATKPVGRLLDLQSEATKSIKHSVDQLMDYSRLDHLQATQPRPALEINGFVAELVQRHNTAAKQVRLTLRNELPGGFAADLNALLFELTVENLISNALKFSPEGAPITVTLSLLENEWALRVEDRGRGIPEGELAQVFDPFFRASNVGPTPGAGLGLAIARRAVQHAGGTIVATSASGNGSCFTCRYPIRPVISPAQTPTTAPPS